MTNEEAQKRIAKAKKEAAYYHNNPLAWFEDIEKSERKQSKISSNLPVMGSKSCPKCGSKNIETKMLESLCDICIECGSYCA